jgi:hypothetical protein
MNMNIDKFKWTLNVEEDSKTGDAVIEFPSDFLEIVGWCEGDTINWHDNEDGSWSLTKVVNIRSE